MNSKSKISENFESSTEAPLGRRELNKLYGDLLSNRRPTMSYENTRNQFDDTRCSIDSSASTIFTTIPHSFWEVLTEDIIKEDSHMRSAINLLLDIKNRLLALLTPANKHVKPNIDKIFDEETMELEAKSGKLDLRVYTTQILNTLESICIPNRESKIRELHKTTDAVLALKQIVDIIGEIKADMSKYAVHPAFNSMDDSNDLRDRKIVADFLYNFGDLPQTEFWLRKYFDPSLTTKEILCNAILGLVVANGTGAYAETLMMHIPLLESLKLQYYHLVISAAGLLSLCTHLPDVLCTAKTRQQYFVTLSSLLQGINTDGELMRILPNAVRQINSETTRKLRELKNTSLTESRMRDLGDHLKRLSDPTYKVRKSVANRIQKFLKDSLATEGAIPVPSELHFISSDLTDLSVRLNELARTNTDECLHFYEKVLNDIKENATDKTRRKNIDVQSLPQ